MPEKRKIVIIEPKGRKNVCSVGRDSKLEFFYPEGPIEQSMVRKVSEHAYGAIITSSCGFSADDMEVLPFLRIIAKCGGKPSSVDIGAATEKGIAVTTFQGQFDHGGRIHCDAYPGLPETFSFRIKGHWQRAEQEHNRHVREGTQGKDSWIDRVRRGRPGSGKTRLWDLTARLRFTIPVCSSRQ